MLNWTASRSTIAAPQQQCYGTQAYLPDVAITLNNLAVLYRATQRMKEAEDAYREALSIRRQLAKANPGVAGFWNPSKQQPVAFDMFQGAVPPTQERRMSGGRVQPK